MSSLTPFFNISTIAPTSGLDATVNGLLEQSKMLLEAFIANPSEDLGRVLESLQGKIAELAKEQGQVSLSNLETERLRMQQFTYAIQSNNWREVQVAQANAQSTVAFYQHYYAMQTAQQYGYTQTFQALVQHCPQAVTNLLALKNNQPQIL